MADRVGVINKGELILVEDKAELMHKLGKKQMTLELQQKLDAVPAGARSPTTSRLAADGQRADLHLRGAGRAARRDAADRGAAAPGHPAQGHQHHAKLARRHLRRSGEEASHELSRGLGDLQVRDGAHRAHPLPEHRVAGDLDVALFRGVRRRDRLAHPGDRQRQLRRVHRAGADHDDAADAERHERLVRHLFPALRRHDLRNSLGAGVGVRDRAGLCRRGRHQVDHPRPDHRSRPRRCSCRSGSSIRSGCWPSWC